jgi:hypothetical protein
VTQKPKTKLLKKLVKGLAVKAHHSDKCLLVLRCQLFLPWRLMKWNKSTAGDFSVSLTPFLNEKTFEEVFAVAGVFLLVEGPLLFSLTIHQK